MNDHPYLIIGNGVAGITAAQDIRQADANHPIVIISDEGIPYYYRASMSEWLSGQLDDTSIMGRTPEFYTHMRLETRHGHVARVNPDTHTVELESGNTLPYNKLLIATGARANTFPVEGLDNIIVFRDFADAKHIQQRLGCCGRALILGGGILGLELAGALHSMGLENIAIVQRSAFVGKPLLDLQAAQWLQAQMLRDGITLFLNDTVTRVEGQTAHFTSGETWDFDIFVQAVGITPVFPETPGLKTGRGIQIDAHARTNLPDIYAAGDCTETYHPTREQWEPTRIWLDCARQGHVAACSMTGREASLTEFPFFNASLIYTSMYTYIGEAHGQGGKSYVWQRDHAYRKIRVVDGKLAGALLMGNRHGAMGIYKAIGQTVKPFNEAVVNPDFPWNDLSEPNWDHFFY